jgi:methionyl-tRNA synthetase
MDEWSCSNCTLTNDADSDKCAACEVAKPAPKKEKKKVVESEEEDVEEEEDEYMVNNQKFKDPLLFKNL